MLKKKSNFAKKIPLKTVLLITPPFTQLNTPYPATAYIKGFLNTKNIPSYQMDLGIEVLLKLFSKKGLQLVFDSVNKNELETFNLIRIYNLNHQYCNTIDAVILFLQGKNPSLARQICSGSFLPQAARFETVDDLEWAFGNMGMQDKAKHLATLYLEDISDFIVSCVDENFGFSRYAERLGRSANSFDDLYQKLNGKTTFVDTLSLSILRAKIQEINPVLVCFSVPFPGNLYSAFKAAQFIKKEFPTIKTAMGGGFPNTELRSLKETRVFEFFDYITLDDGERPLELVYQNVIAKNSTELPIFKRTFLLKDAAVFYDNSDTKPDYKQTETGTPDYSDLLLNSYISVIEIANPMHSLWSDGRWNKLTMAHGCYWGKCTFCDISLDYIKRYEPATAKLLVDRMEILIAQTGENGFHFVDEAAPPALMREVALEILSRNLIVSWWTNIRFEKSFTADLCKLLKASGCIAVSGGLEVASDRLLALIKKGVTVEQVAQVCKNFTENGIMVHAYLMYGFPSQTVQETIDSLEMVRQLFEIGIVNSGFWHQFAMTAHAPVGLFPEEFGVIPVQNSITFAHNDIDFKDKTAINHNKFSFGLKKALFNYKHGICFEYPLQDWFEFKIPKTQIPANFIKNATQQKNTFYTKPTAKIVWIGGGPISEKITKSKKGSSWELLQLTFQNNSETLVLNFSTEEGFWLLSLLEKCVFLNENRVTFQEIRKDFEQKLDNFELFWYSKNRNSLTNFGLLVL
jgi:hypothetical protein